MSYSDDLVGNWIKIMKIYYGKEQSLKFKLRSIKFEFLIEIFKRNYLSRTGDVIIVSLFSILEIKTRYKGMISNG